MYTDPIKKGKDKVIYISRHRTKQRSIFIGFSSAAQQLKIEFVILFLVNRAHLRNVGYEINFQRILT